jgi:hypothetical protein
MGSTVAQLASDTRRLQLTAGYARGTARQSVRIGFMQDVSDGSIRALAGFTRAF